MSSVPDLDFELAAKIVANLSGPPERLINDFNDEAGELIPSDAHRFRQRLEVLEEEALGSNLTEDVIQVDLDVIVRMARSGGLLAPRTYLGDIWTDQQQLVKLSFWQDLVAVKQVRPDTNPVLIEDITQNAEILIYTMQVFLILQP